MTEEQKLYQYISINYIATKKELSTFLNVSIKTIENYLFNIKIQPKIFKSKIIEKNGYFFIKNSNFKKPKNSAKEFILKEFLIYDRNIDHNQIEERFYISNSTFKRKLLEIKQDLKKINKNYEIIFDKKINKYYCKITFSQKTIVATYLLKNWILNDRKIINELTKLLDSYFQITNSYKLEFILLNIYCLMKRSTFSNKDYSKDKFIFKLEKLFSKKVEKNSEKIIYKLIKSSLENKVEKDVFNFVETFFKKIDEQENTSFFKNKSFISKIATHISMFLKKEGFVENPVVNKIKESYLFEHRIATLLAKEINHKFNKWISDEEVSYLIIHISLGSFQIETQKVYLYSNLGIGIVNFLKKKILQHFNNIVFLEKTSFDKNFILISTTKDIPFQFKKAIVINPFLEEEDVKKIKFVLKNKSKKNFKVFKKFEEFNNKKTQTKSILKELVNHLNVQNKEKIIKKIIERERISTTNLNNGIAVPHVFYHDQKNAGIYIFKLSKAVNWISGTSVNLIILSLVFEKDKEQIQSFFKKLSHFVLKIDKSKIEEINQQNIRKIIETI